MGRILRYLATHSTVLRLVFLALSVWSLTTFYAVWLLQKLWQTQGVELAHFGWLWGGLTLLAAFAGRWAHRFEDLVVWSDEKAKDCDLSRSALSL